MDTVFIVIETIEYVLATRTADSEHRAYCAPKLEVLGYNNNSLFLHFVETVCELLNEIVLEQENVGRFRMILA